ncbi:MAG: hypothetical protein ABFS45_10400 [Pseudomonadota bacterium]
MTRQVNRTLQCIFSSLVVLFFTSSAVVASHLLEGGHAGLACTDCHLYQPDPEIDTRETVTFVTTTREELCVSCHETLPLLEYTNSPTTVRHNAQPVLSAKMYTFYTNWLDTYNLQNGTALNGFDLHANGDGTYTLNCTGCHRMSSGPIYPDIPMDNAEMCVACHGGEGNYDPGVTRVVFSSQPRILYNPTLLGVVDDLGDEFTAPWDPTYDGQPPADGNSVSEQVPLPLSFFRSFHSNIQQELNYRVDISGIQNDSYVEIDPRPVTWYTGIGGNARWLNEKPMYYWDTTGWPGDTYLVELTPFNPLDSTIIGLPYTLSLIVEDDLTPVEQIEQLINIVQSLNLQTGIDNSLDAKLDAALQALSDVNQNNNVAAINTLEAFINATLAQRGSHIPEAEVDEIIALAKAAIEALTAS